MGTSILLFEPMPRGRLLLQPPLLARAEGPVPLVAPSTGAMVLHEPVHPWIFNVRAPYQREAEKAAAEAFALDGELCELQLWDQHRTGEILVGEGHVAAELDRREHRVDPRRTHHRGEHEVAPARVRAQELDGRS